MRVGSFIGHKTESWAVNRVESHTTEREREAEGRQTSEIDFSDVVCSQSAAAAASWSQPQDDKHTDVDPESILRQQQQKKTLARKIH